MLWSIVQGGGALVGLATGIFVLHERLTKNSPVAFLVGVPPLGTGRRFLYVRIANRCDYPILVKFENGAAANKLLLMANHSTVSIVEAQTVGNTLCLLDPKETRDFPVLEPLNLGASQKVQATIAWRYGHSAKWRRWRVLKISSTKETIAILKKDSSDFS